jgi:hypothetical protein
MIGTMKLAEKAAASGGAAGSNSPHQCLISAWRGVAEMTLVSRRWRVHPLA